MPLLNAHHNAGPRYTLCGITCFACCSVGILLAAPRRAASFGWPCRFLLCLGRWQRWTVTLLGRWTCQGPGGAHAHEQQGSAGRRQTSRPPTRTSRPPRSASVPCCAPHGHVCRCSGHSDLHAAQRTSRRPAAPSPSSHDGGKAGPGPGERTAPLMVGPGGRDVTLVRTRVSTANSGTIPRHSGILRPLSGANSF